MKRWKVFTISILAGIFIAVTGLNTAVIYLHNKHLRNVNEVMREQNVITLELINNQRADYAKLWDLHQRMLKLEKQQDLIAAASRGSWAQAYRLMRDPDVRAALDE